MMRILFVTISIVVAARIFIINLTTQDSNIDIQVMQMIIFILNIVLILTLTWSIRDSTKKMK
jgi:hypothetical protein